MKQSDSIVDTLVKGMKQGIFDKYHKEELAKREAHTKDQLLNAACTFAAYIRMLNTGLYSDIDLLLQAHTNGMKARITRVSAAGAQGRDALYEPLRGLTFELVKGKATKLKSIRHAARVIAPEIIRVAELRDIPLSKINAEETIKGWITNLVKKGDIPPFPTQKNS